MVYVGTSLFSLFGLSGSSPVASILHNELKEVELHWEWKVWSTSSTPAARFMAPAKVYGTKIYVFGGATSSDGAGVLNDFHVLDTAGGASASSWTQLSADLGSTSPSRRHSAGLAIVTGGIPWLVGGVEGNSAIVMGEFGKLLIFVKGFGM